MPESGAQVPEARNEAVGRAVAHDSAAKHSSGRALYVDDLPEPAGTLYAAPGMASIASGRVKQLDLSAVRSAPGVVAVLTAADVPGANEIGPVRHDEPLFAGESVSFHGQLLFAVIAVSQRAARAAARLARVAYAPLTPVLDPEAALAAGDFVAEPYVMARGEAEQAIATAPHRLAGGLSTGGQEHFYLEGQVALAVPQEDGDLLLYCSTQHPSEVQHVVARLLARSDHAVTVEVRRMGGGFGGKETQAAQWAAVAALAAVRTGRPIKFRLDRDDDFLLTGKRHPFRLDFEVGFEATGRIRGIAFRQVADCGHSADLSAAIADRAMFHADNAYYLEAVLVRSWRCRTNKVSNTAFRGFGGPQGMMGIEEALDRIALALGRDPLDVRKENLYGGPGRDVTPYHMQVEDNILPELVARLEASSDYRVRRAAIAAFNRASPVIKRGLALTPVKFGISFTTTHLNQAGALLHLYSDGSLHLNHGGTEMGQGLFVKVAQVVAEELQVDLARVKITATNTGKVPNTSATAASSGSDLNGMAALAAARKLKRRLTEFAAERYGLPEAQIVFLPNRLLLGNREIAFEELAREAYLARVPLSATGFYRTPKIHFDRGKAAGRPFLYFAYGAAVSEVAIDCLTGESRVLRADLLHDVGRSLNPAIDLGQIEGGFLQGQGWLTSEELWWDKDGRLATHAPSTYKIPTASDRPRDLRIALFEGENREATVYRSKAVGEPPLMLAISVFRALWDAVAAVAEHRIAPRLDAPATPERLLAAVEALRAEARAG